MPEKLLSYIKAFEDWGAAYGFAWGMLLTVVFFVFFYISIRAISKVGKGTQRNFQFLKSGLDDRDIVMAERSQKIVATLNDLRGMLKQGKQWEAKSKSTEEQRENFEHLLVAVEESTKTIKNAVTEQEMYLHDRFATLANDNKTNSNIPPETLSEITQKITQMEERLEDIINNRLSGLDYIEGLDEKISSLTVSRWKKISIPKLTSWRTAGRHNEQSLIRIFGIYGRAERKNIIVFRCAIGNGQNQQKCHPIIAAFVASGGGTLARERLSDLLAQSLPPILSTGSPLAKRQLCQRTFAPAGTKQRRCY